MILLVTARADAHTVSQLDALLKQPGETISRLFLFGDATSLAVQAEWQAHFQHLFEKYSLEGSVCMTALSRRSPQQPLAPWKAGSLGDLAGWLHQFPSRHLA